MLNEARLKRLFLELTAFNSPPGEEGPVGDYCAAALRGAGFETSRDAAGNLVAARGLDRPGQAIFLSGHVDTVAPTAGLEVQEQNGVFRTNGRTILGADDKCAVAAILEAAYQIEERSLPHGPLRIVLSVQEEVGLMGAQQLDLEPLRGSMGFVFDAAGPTGAIITAAPSHDIFEVRIKGKAAHAGFVPEEGVSAICAASRGIAAMRLGRIDAETTANIGIIHGGTANNVVAEECYIKAEARSRDEGKLAAQVRHMREQFEAGAAEVGARVEITGGRAYSGYRHEPDAPAMRLAAEGLRRAGKEPSYRETGGGSDANIFNARGIPSVVVSCGYENAHSVEEYMAFADIRLNALWCLGLVEAAAKLSAELLPPVLRYT
jgi:tripeptide aminopeptidase